MKWIANNKHNYYNTYDILIRELMFFDTVITFNTLDNRENPYYVSVTRTYFYTLADAKLAVLKHYKKVLNNTKALEDYFKEIINGYTCANGYNEETRGVFCYINNYGGNIKGGKYVCDDKYSWICGRHLRTYYTSNSLSLRFPKSEGNIENIAVKLLKREIKRFLNFINNQ